MKIQNGRGLCAALILAAVATASMLQAQSVYTWNADGGGNWNTTNSTGWNTNGFPSTAGDTAYFTNDITGNRTITINVSTATVGALYLADAVPSHNWTITRSSTNVLNMATVSGPAGIYSLSGSNTISAPISLGTNLTIVVQGYQLTISEALIGTHNLIISNGLVIFNKASASYLIGNVVISIATGATLRVSSYATLSDGTQIAIAAGGLYDYQTSGEDYIADISGAGNVNVGSGSILHMGGWSTELSGNLTGSGTIREVGGNLTLSGSNSLSGAMQLGAGAKISVKKGNAVNDIAPFQFGYTGAPVTTSAVLEVVNSETVGSVASVNGTGAIDLDSGATLITGASDASTTFAGPLRSSGSLVKTGVGTFTLTGTNFYTGTTIVSNGTLLVNGFSTNGGNDMVVSGATLGGTGVIDPSSSKTVTVAVGAVLLPGGTNGTLTIGSPAGNNNLQLNGALRVTGDASRDSSTPWLRIEGNLLLGPSSSVTGTNLALLSSASSYVLASYSGSRSNALASTSVDSRWAVRYDDANHRLLLIPLNNTTILLR